MRIKGARTVTAEAGIVHNVAVYISKEIWGEFDKLRRSEGIKTRSQAFRLMMKNAIHDKKIKRDNQYLSHN
jgi:metal-responsive CopG/Arc/MetJ family transcriptional regulator